MASEENKTVETNEESSEWKINQLVWAKIPGYPYWPAIIVDVNNVPSAVLDTPHSDDQTLVRFFGDGSYGWINDILDFKEHFDKNSKKRNKDLTSAIKEAEEFSKTGVFPIADLPKTASTEYDYQENEESDDEEDIKPKKRRQSTKKEGTSKKRKTKKGDKYDESFLDLSDDEIVPKTPKTRKVTAKKIELRKEIYEIVREVTKKYNENEYSEALEILKKINPFNLVQNPDTGKEEKSKYSKLTAEDIKIVDLGKLVHILSTCEHKDLSTYATKLYEYYLSSVKKELKVQKLKKAAPILSSLKKAQKNKESTDKPSTNEVTQNDVNIDEQKETESIQNEESENKINSESNPTTEQQDEEIETFPLEDENKIEPEPEQNTEQQDEDIETFPLEDENKIEPEPEQNTEQQEEEPETSMSVETKNV